MALLVFSGPGRAQTVAVDRPSGKVEQLLELLDDPEIKAWLAEKSAQPTPLREPGLDDTVAAWEAAIRNRVKGLVAALPAFPQEFARAAGVALNDAGSGSPATILALVVLVVAGFGAEWMVRRSMKSAGAVRAEALAGEVSALATFSLASFAAFLAFDWPPLLHRIVLALLAATIAFRFVRAIAAFVLAMPSGTLDVDRAASGSSRDARRFWRRRIDLFAGIVILGWAAVGILRALGMSPDASRLVADLLGLCLLAASIDAVWRRPDQTASKLRRVLLSAFLVLLWPLWTAGMLGLLWLGIFALILPAAVRAAGKLAQALAGTARPAGATGVMVDILVVRGARALVIACAVLWLAYVWRFGVGASTGSELLRSVVSGSLNAVIVLLIADLLWQLCRGLINHRLERISQAADGAGDAARASRLKTLLPIFRNTLAVFIAVVSVLTILSGLGVQVLPLIAGAGVFGIAIGFGSQTLVKDVLSGVFFMLDDAFRVGEYIQSGSYQGTVESFSLRSVRLRHHRGSIFTVPFGQLGAVQNMSRDWAIEKITIRVTYDSNIELARKLIKQIGEELAADPEFASDTLQPLKMQGIENFGDFAIELNMKLMTKPGAQTPIKRRAYMMIRKAFAENGIRIAVPTVHVEGSAEHAAAAQQVLKMNQAAETAKS